MDGVKKKGRTRDCLLVANAFEKPSWEQARHAPRNGSCIPPVVLIRQCSCLTRSQGEVQRPTLGVSVFTDAPGCSHLITRAELTEEAKKMRRDLQEG